MVVQALDKVLVLLLVIAPLLATPTAHSENTFPELELVVNAPAVVSPNAPALLQIVLKNNCPLVKPLTEEQIQRLSNDEQATYCRRYLWLQEINIADWSSSSAQSPPFSVEIQDEQGSIVRSLVPPNEGAFFHDNAQRGFNEYLGEYMPASARRPHIRIRPDESHRWFLDIRPWLDGVQPGNYRIVVAVYGQAGYNLMLSAPLTPLSRSAPITIRVDQPSEDPRANMAFIELRLSAPGHAWRGLPTLIKAVATNTADDVTLPSNEVLQAMEDAQRTRLVNHLLLGAKISIPEWNILSEYPAPFSIEVRDVDGTVRQPTKAPAQRAFYVDNAQWVRSDLMAPYIPPSFRRPHAIMRPGESNVWLVDLGPSLRDLPDGEYDIVLSAFGHLGDFLTVDHSRPLVQSKPFRIRIGTLDEATVELIRQGAPKFEVGANEGFTAQQWLKPEVEMTFLHFASPAHVRSALSVVGVLHSAVNSKPEETQVQAWLNVIPEHLESTRKLLEYEWLVMRRETKIASEMRAELQKRPELVAELRQIERGQGLIGLYRLKVKQEAAE